MTIRFITVLAVAGIISACGSSSSTQRGPTPSANPTATASNSPAPSSSPAATATPIPSASTAPTSSPSASPAPAQTALFMATESGELIGLFAEDPSQLLSRVTINNLMSDDPSNPPFAAALDIHPSTGDFYLLQTDLRLYTVNPVTGDASLVGQALGSLGLTSANIGAMDFDSVTEEIRLLDSTTGDSYRVSAADATLISQDTALQYAAGDTFEGMTVFPIGLSYDGSKDSTERTAFVLDDFNDVLARLGDENDDADSANSGTLTTIGPWGFTQESSGLSVLASGNMGYAISLSDSGGDQTVLSEIDLGSGSNTNLGQIGNESGRFVALALAVVPSADNGSEPGPSASPSAAPSNGPTASPSSSPSASPSQEPSDGGDGGLAQTCIDQGTDAGFPEEQVRLFCETAFGSF